MHCRGRNTTTKVGGAGGTYHNVLIINCQKCGAVSLPLHWSFYLSFYLSFYYRDYLGGGADGTYHNVLIILSYQLSKSGGGGGGGRAPLPPNISNISATKYTRQRSTFYHPRGSLDHFTSMKGKANSYNCR